MDSKPSFQELYQAGLNSFERGEYRTSIAQLTAAVDAATPGSLAGGQAGLKLVYAYQGLGEAGQAINLCRSLTTHPSYDVRREAKQLLYILEAPRLKRPEEWMSKIPDLGNLPDSEPKYKRGTNQPKKEENPIEPMNLDVKQNYQFIFFAFVFIVLLFGVSFLLSPGN